MKLKISLVLFFLLLFPAIILPQKIITLRECYDKAKEKTSLSKEKEAYNSIWQLKDKNLSRNWLPSLDANASILYNSEVADMSSVLGSLPIPGIGSAIKPLPHEQYKITVDVNQVIYDGGAVKKAKQFEKADLNVNLQTSEADIYKVKDQVNTCYFSLLLIERQKELLKTYLELIVKRLKSVQSAADNGMILKSDIDVLTSEKIKIEQQINENSIRKESLLAVLTDITGIPAARDVTFVLPETESVLTMEISRPELKIFDLRKEQLEAGIGLIDSKKMPKAFGFATLGYGNPPGSNFFKDQFAPYYIIGAGVKWNIFDWNKSKSEKQQIKIQQEIIDSRKTDMTDNLKRALELKKAEISALTSLIEKDSELIAIRKRITGAAASQYENGTLTATDYMKELTAEKEAAINYEIHKINLGLKKVEYLNISGKDLE